MNAKHLAGVFTDAGRGVHSELNDRHRLDRGPIDLTQGWVMRTELLEEVPASADCDSRRRPWQVALPSPWPDVFLAANKL